MVNHSSILNQFLVIHRFKTKALLKLTRKLENPLLELAFFTSGTNYS